MALQRYLMEGGAEGDDATLNNTGASLVFPGNGTITFASARGRNGRGLSYTSQPGAQTETRWDAAASNMTMSFRGWFYSPSSTPTETIGICNVRNSSGVAARVQWTTTNSLILVPVSGSTLTIATGLATGAQFDLSLQIVVGTTGSIAATLRSASNASLGTVNSASFNSGTTAIVSVATGILGSFTNSYTTGWDEVSLDDGATTEISLYTPPDAPLSGNFDLVWDGTQWR